MCIAFRSLLSLFLDVDGNSFIIRIVCLPSVRHGVSAGSYRIFFISLVYQAKMSAG